MDFSFKPSDWLAALNEFGSFINTPVSADGMLTIPSYVGEGYIRAGIVSPEFSYLLLKANMKHTVSLVRKKISGADDYYMFFLDSFSKDPLLFRDEGESFYTGVESVHVITIGTARKDRAIVFPAGADISMIAVQFNERWLENHLTADTRARVKMKADESVELQLKNVMQNEVVALMRQTLELEDFYPHFQNSQESSIFMMVHNFFDSLGQQP